MNSRQRIVSFLIIILSGFFFQTSEVWGHINQKTPNDTYSKTQIILNHVAYIREKQGIDAPITIEIPPQKGKTPGHVLKKSYEILEKISKFRVNNSYGPITIPPFPTREITPDEVYESTQRIINELELLEEFLKISNLELFNRKVIFIEKTPNDVYRALWQISVAFDTLLGVRGFTPTDVYAQTQRLLGEVNFLRQQQGIGGYVPKPKKLKGKHPNHALASSYKLLNKIILAEKNLWMNPAASKKVPLRVITPTEVYDSVGEVLAEIQRIKFRLGIEHIIPIVKEISQKTPDDVIQNLEWAALLMPEFNTFQIKQRNRKHMQRTPAHVYALTEKIIKELERLRVEKNIKHTSRERKIFSKKEPKHVFIKTTECLEKLNIYRKHIGLGEITKVHHPLREITPNEVYETMFRLYQEIQLLKNENIIQEKDVFNFETFKEKTSMDVFTQALQISQLLDTLLGSKGEYTPSDVFVKVVLIRKEFVLLRERLGVSTDVENFQFEEGKTPKDNMEKAFEILKLLNQIRSRSGIFENELPKYRQGKPLPEDVFNIVDYIIADIIELKMTLGITQYVEDVEFVSEKTPSHVYEQMELLKRLLESIIYQYSHE
ncbi:hypothetical protein MNBD_UNCLBAC01-1124 [hydrothermal vent metagenome]|uniref:Uncharacterized protein n=1 Tax=hydrothermal vent metagenome TaxID=652676 RepID=A0A3B1DIL6_9ZZZZ